MIKRFKVDNLNYISYKIVNDYGVIYYLNLDDVAKILPCMHEYFKHLKSLDLEYVGCYPGCNNPLVIKAAIDVIKSYNFNYRLFYNKEEVKNLTEFEQGILDLSVSKCMTVKDINAQCSCSGQIGQFSKQNGFKVCSVFAPLKRNLKNIQLPMRYYEIKQDGFLVGEYMEKPNNNKKYYEAVGLEEMFLTNDIQLINEKLKYHPKSIKGKI